MNQVQIEVRRETARVDCLSESLWHKSRRRHLRQCQSVRWKNDKDGQRDSRLSVGIVVSQLKSASCTRPYARGVRPTSRRFTLSRINFRSVWMSTSTDAATKFQLQLLFISKSGKGEAFLVQEVMIVYVHGHRRYQICLSSSSLGRLQYSNI